MTLYITDSHQGIPESPPSSNHPLLSRLKIRRGARRQEDIDYDRVDQVMTIFISIIPRLTYHPRTYTTSAAMEEVIRFNIDFDLPDNYAPVISKKVHSVIRDHQLPFHRKNKTKVRQAAFVGIDQGEVERLFVNALKNVDSIETATF